MHPRFSPRRLSVSSLACLFIALASPASFGAAARQQAQAQLLDHGELICSNCFFGRSNYYYCFAAGDRILIGRQSAPVFNWKNKSKNYLTRLHSGWDQWQVQGQTVPIQYDNKHIWVTRADGKEVKLTQDYNSDIFSNNQRCQNVVKKPQS